jgi:hypothetical protein
MPVVASTPNAEISRLMMAGFKELLPEADQIRMADSQTPDKRFRLFHRNPRPVPSPIA